jgi:hypothetical protein
MGSGVAVSGLEREQAGIDMMIAVREVLEKHGSSAVLGAIQQFAECLADHMREQGTFRSVTAQRLVIDELTKAVYSLALVSGHIDRAERTCGITLADAAEVFIA